jgi:hypothetical protein
LVLALIVVNHICTRFASGQLILVYRYKDIIHKKLAGAMVEGRRTGQEKLLFLGIS